MKNIEKIISGLILGSIFPLLLGLISITIWFLIDKAENRPLIYLVIGLLLGGLVDLKFLHSWIIRRFSLSIWTIVSIYLVYNVFVYGFFMGFPVFNVLLGILAGYYFGNRICYNKVNIELHKKRINQVSLFSGLIMALVCIPSGFLALIENEAAGMIKEVFRLDFEVTGAMIWGIVLIGGSILVLTSTIVTRITMTITLKKHFH